MTNGVRVQQRTQTKGIIAHDVTMTFDDVDVVRSLDLTVEPGSIVGLIGPSGCGKTTTVRMLTGLLTPTSGTATVDGVPAHDLTAQATDEDRLPPAEPCVVQRPVGVGEPQLPRLDVRPGVPAAQAAAQLLDWVELSDDSRKRVARHVRGHAATARARRDVRPRSRAFSSSTNRRPGSTRSCGRSSGPSSARSPARAGRCW